ncbi:polyketide cyclase/dehydrase/lipid transport protein [Streptomyces sp. SLBN-118]|uniref:SRPBCC family protein n=1 Tax=Streptomyces sp. SLBN-118 TaxID=2768454 RepID=UPI001150A517|nr:SRPBCC family protein [Streptomyces sp. SLBN-118]TQK43009.1 polyketide cyclase/dehydrase/lipid transport protein [Streptomyces sp. SLBN-118]
MGEFRLTRAVALPADEAWSRVTDWRGHAAQVPLTAVRVMTPPPTGVGTRFVARSGVGRACFDDPMEVVGWEPPAGGRPGRCRLEKRGSVITGWAEIEVLPQGPGAVVVWVEQLHIRFLPRLLDPLVARAGRLVFGRALDGLLLGSSSHV